MPAEFDARRWVRRGVATVLSSAAAILLMSAWGCSVAQVQGFSMAPTLENRDYLVVDRLAYDFADPRRGDIVMLAYPHDPDMWIVKRVIAVAGDVVEIVDGRVTIDGRFTHDVNVPPAFRSYDRWGPARIPAGYYFVMGDHRNKSSDSRHWGTVPRRDILGRIAVRWWPLRGIRRF